MALHLPPTERSLLQAEKELVEAMRQNDPERLGELLHEQLRFRTPDGQIIGKEDDLAAYRSGKMQVNSLKVLDREVEVGDGTAEVRAKTELAGVFEGQSFAAQFLFTRDWVWEAGKWWVIGGSSRPL